jgi:hypothetical protein
MVLEAYPMSFTDYMDRAYSATLMNDEEEDAGRRARREAERDEETEREALIALAVRKEDI